LTQEDLEEEVLEGFQEGFDVVWYWLSEWRTGEWGQDERRGWVVSPPGKSCSSSPDMYGKRSLKWNLNG